MLLSVYTQLNDIACYARLTIVKCVIFRRINNQIWRFAILELLDKMRFMIAVAKRHGICNSSRMPISLRAFCAAVNDAAPLTIIGMPNLRPLAFMRLRGTVRAEVPLSLPPRSEHRWL